jgi:hypothetical protein
MRAFVAVFECVFRAYMRIQGSLLVSVLRVIPSVLQGSCNLAQLTELDSAWQALTARYRGLQWHYSVWQTLTVRYRALQGPYSV